MQRLRLVYWSLRLRRHDATPRNQSRIRLWPMQRQSWRTPMCQVVSRRSTNSRHKRCASAESKNQCYTQTLPRKRRETTINWAFLAQQFCLFHILCHVTRASITWVFFHAVWFVVFSVIVFLSVGSASEFSLGCHFRFRNIFFRFQNKSPPKNSKGKSTQKTALRS